MINCNTSLLKFHDTYIRLSEDNQNDLRDKRKNNQDRLSKGLVKNSNPSVKKFMKQGSYAMRTITQHPNKAYDIDDGVVFNKEDLKNTTGGYKPALEIRKMVHEAFGEDKRFSTNSELRPNCIRINYKEGYHVDVPVYRYSKVDNNELLELASTSWMESDPEKVTKWFNSEVKKQSPELASQSKQMRRITRYVKYWANSVKSWNMPSGFIISVLVSECYVPDKSRDDQALFYTLKQINSRLKVNKTSVRHPILSTNLAEGKESNINVLIEKLEKALNNILCNLENSMCTESQALKAWKKFFHNHEYFDLTVSNESSVFGNEPAKAATVGGQNIYARKGT